MLTINDFVIGFAFIIVIAIAMGLIISLFWFGLYKTIDKTLKTTSHSGSKNSLAGLGIAVSSIGDIWSVNDKIAKIKNSDPNFNEQLFKEDVNAIFYNIQKACNKKEISLVRPFVSDSTLEYFNNKFASPEVLFEEAKTNNSSSIFQKIFSPYLFKNRLSKENFIDKLQINNTYLVKVSSDSNFDYITVKIETNIASYTFHGQPSINSYNRPEYIEYWTFLRSIGVKTNLEKQIKNNVCPNCGGTLEVNAVGKCNYCAAVVTSGQFDWVVSEISQD